MLEGLAVCAWRKALLPQRSSVAANWARRARETLGRGMPGEAGAQPVAQPRELLAPGPAGRTIRQMRLELKGSGKVELSIQIGVDKELRLLAVHG